MTNVDGLLKGKDITLPSKVRLVKAMVFPVVTYGCESWTIKKADSQRIDAFELWCWRSGEVGEVGEVEKSIVVWTWESLGLQRDQICQS